MQTAKKDKSFAEGLEQICIAGKSQRFLCHPVVERSRKTTHRTFQNAGRPFRRRSRLGQQFCDTPRYRLPCRTHRKPFYGQLRRLPVSSFRRRKTMHHRHPRESHPENHRPSKTLYLNRVSKSCGSKIAFFIIVTIIAFRGFYCYHSNDNLQHTAYYSPEMAFAGIIRCI